MTEKQAKFRRALGKIIREELRTILPEVLSEMYVRSLAAGQVRPAPVAAKPQPRRQPSLAEQLGEDDQVPEVQPNQHRGVYEPIGDAVSDEDNPANRERLRAEIRQRLLDSNPEIYEGVTTAQPSTPLSGDGGVPLKYFNFDKAMQLDEELKRDAQARAPLSSNADAKMREIEMRRKMLEVPVGTRVPGVV